ncbi:hypothetical protein [Intrasporangium mesophilum]
MTVQQGLTTPRRLAAAQRVVRARTRRRFIRDVVRDIIGLRLETDLFMDQVAQGLASLDSGSMYERAV